VEASTSDEHGTSSMNLRINTVIALRTSRSSEIFSVFVPAASVSAAPGAKQIYICCQNKDLISFFFVCVFVCVCVCVCSWVRACHLPKRTKRRQGASTSQNRSLCLCFCLCLCLFCLCLCLFVCVCDGVSSRCITVYTLPHPAYEHRCSGLKKTVENELTASASKA
jgi:hypothetical protein